jgi:hypothetical protein
VPDFDFLSFLGLGGPHLTDAPAFQDFFEALDHLNDGQLMAMAAAFQGTPRDEHERAWSAVRSVGERDGLAKEIERVRAKALGWASKGSNIVLMVGSGIDDIGWAQMKHEAAEPIVDAALAVALGDRLDEAARGTLLAGWTAAQEARETR